MGLCELLAVLSGAILADVIDEKKTMYVGGALFLIFALESCYEAIYTTDS